MVRQNPHFCQSVETILKEKSTLLAMQGWIFLHEDYGIAVRKPSLTWGSHILPHSHILIRSLHRSTNNMKKRRISTVRVIDIEKSSFNPLVFTTRGGIAPESIKEWLKKQLKNVVSYMRLEWLPFHDGCKQGIDQQIFFNLLIDSLLTPIVESTYLNRDVCKFASSQKDESRGQSTNSSKACRNTSAFKCVDFH